MYQERADSSEAKLSEQSTFTATLQDKMQQLIGTCSGPVWLTRTLTRAAVTRNLKKELDEAKEKLDQRTRSTSQAIRSTGALEARVAQSAAENAKLLQENKALQEQLNKLQTQQRERSPSVVAQHRDMDLKYAE